MQVRRLKVFPIEAVVRGYITGSAWQEYKERGTVNGIDIDGVRLGGEVSKSKRKYMECEKLERPLYTPSTKAEVGGMDVNIHPDEGNPWINTPCIENCIASMQFNQPEKTKERQFH